MTLDWDFSWALAGKHRRGLFMLSELSHSMAAGVQEGAPQEKEVEEHSFFFFFNDLDSEVIEPPLSHPLLVKAVIKVYSG